MGIRLSLPIYDGKQTQLNKQEYMIRGQINRNNIEKFKADFEYERKSAFSQLEKNKADLIDTDRNIALARQILTVDQLRFEKGVLTVADLKNSEYTVQNAENNYLNALYNVLVATVRYRKAAGLF